MLYSPMVLLTGMWSFLSDTVYYMVRSWYVLRYKSIDTTHYDAIEHVSGNCRKYIIQQYGAAFTLA